MHHVYWIYYFLLLVVLVCGLVMAVLTMPGLWLMAAGAGGYALLTHRQFLGIKTMIALLVICIVAEVIELMLGGAIAKKAGGGRRAMIGGVVGGILGGIFLSFIPIPVISTIFGICLGSFLGATALELEGGREVGHSLKIGLGAAKGRFLGIVSKLIFGLAMFLLAMIAAWP